MDQLAIDDEARLRRRVYADVVRAVLRRYARHADVADRAGITREYLQALLQETGLRTASPDTADLIVRALPVPEEQRRDLKEHLLLASEKRLRARRAARREASETSPTELLERLRDAHWAATYAREPEQARAHYPLLRDLAEVFLGHIGLRRSPLVLVEGCLLMHDAQSVLDRPADALFHARFARAIMQRLVRSDFGRDRNRFDHFRVNAPYAEAVTLTTLGLGRAAQDPLLEAKAHADPAQPAGRFWLPHLHRHQVATLAVAPRFALRDARLFADRARSALDRRNDPLDPQVSLLVDESLARAYLRHGAGQSESDLGARKAVALLRPTVDAIERTPYVGALHRVAILRTFAGALYATRDWDEWRHYVDRALDLADGAGLEHQAREMRQSRGAMRT